MLAPEFCRSCPSDGDDESQRTLKFKINEGVDTNFRISFYAQKSAAGVSITFAIQPGLYGDALNYIGQVHGQHHPDDVVGVL
jgi:DnaJ-class molecular chaperone